MNGVDTAAPDARAETPVARSLCANCDAPATGPYCSACGQRHLGGRHTLRSVLRGMVERFTSSEAGFIHTAQLLTTRPGAVISDYWAGRTVRYTHPAAYLLVCVAAFALAFEIFAQGTGAGEGDRVFTLLLIPFVAAASRVLFWRGERNFAEHLIAVMYLCGHVVLGVGVLYIGASFLSGSPLSLYTGAVLLLATGYFLWGYATAFHTRPVRGALAGVAALILGSVIWLVVVAVIVSWFRRISQ